MEFKPIKKTSLSDYVVSQIKGMIIKNEIKIGDKLPNERELSTLFDVSRSSVREALRVLELQGLMRRSNSGTFVTANFSEIIGESLTLQILLNSATYKDIQQTRVMLERELVSSASIKRSEEALNRMKEQLENMEQSIATKDKEMFISADISFHNEIAEAADNSVLVFLYNTIIDLIYKVQRRVAYDQDVLNASVNYHTKIYEAIAERSVREAEQALVEHLEDVEKRLLRLNEMDKIVKEELNSKI
ncbi:FadR/GntR family transcriptional regulator [Halobacillus amylolyticus]|uniref:FadR family transcriptional regulator n=1 Tax=Halobacillus amylolyticus TaxID=2932259 RepID=A0ABY4H925_9BACI|nr:FadR/GntR family transcriptional regulator [Halobacillus amylolyticus]UOR11365.1 FadR family transcriptional regulator [Halobacillus amylolyticus]